MPVEVSVDAFPNKSFSGEITRVNPTVDVATRTFEIEIAVANLDGKLKAGSFARAAIKTRTDTNVKVVPPRAIVSLAGVNKVFLEVDGQAKSVPIEIGLRSSDWVEIRGELPEQAIVITSGHTLLVEGSPVQRRAE